MATCGPDERTSGPARGKTGGRIGTPPVPARTSQAGHLSTLLSAAGLAARESPTRLAGALAASLFLHGLLIAVGDSVTGGTRAPSPGRVDATLHAGAATVAAEPGTGDATQPRPPIAAPEDAPQGAPDRPGGMAVGTLLGERRLLADPPPYLAEPLPLVAPEGGWYFPRAELSQPPMLLGEPQIRFPEEAAGELPRRGKVVVRVLVGSDGAVDRVEVATSTLPSAYQQEAVAAFTGLRFRPGSIDGVAVTSEARIEVVFEPEESGSSHSANPGVRR